MPSDKTMVIDALFEERYTERGLSKTVVTLADIGEAIRQVNNDEGVEMSDRNPANFWKDFTRKKKLANEWWPQHIFDLGFTAKSVTGNGRAFEFVKIQSNQTVPFPEDVPGPAAATRVIDIPTTLLPSIVREMKRNDESLIVQLVARLFIMHYHFCTISPIRMSLVALEHVADGIKLCESEIDTLYIAHTDDGWGNGGTIAITGEAKNQHEDHCLEQIMRQPSAVFEHGIGGVMAAIPCAIKVTGPSEIHVVEFNKVSKGFTDITVAADAVYRLCPRIPGLGEGRVKQSVNIFDQL